MKTPKPSLNLARLRTKKEDHPKLIYHNVLLSVEVDVDLKIPRCKYSFTISSFSPLIVQVVEGRVLEPNTSTLDL